MKDTDKIRNIKSIDFKNYASISSKEKLVVYAIQKLADQDISTSFNNVCIAAYKYFPEAFAFSKDYPEYPHIEMLNRTLLHLRPKERDYATGSAKSEYILTPLGKQIAIQVESEINSESEGTERIIKIDTHKKSARNDYEKLIASEEYAKYIEEGKAQLDMVWNYFEITPFTQQAKVKKTLSGIKKHCGEIEDQKCLTFVNELMNLIK